MLSILESQIPSLLSNAFKTAARSRPILQLHCGITIKDWLRYSRDLEMRGYRDYIHNRLITNYPPPTKRTEVEIFVRHQYTRNTIPGPASIDPRDSLVVWRGNRPKPRINPRARRATSSNASDPDGTGPSAPGPAHAPDRPMGPDAPIRGRPRDSPDTDGHDTNPAQRPRTRAALAGPVADEDVTAEQIVALHHMIPLPITADECAVVSPASGLVYAV